MEITSKAYLSIYKKIDSTVFTFENHPLTEIFPRYAPKLITTNQQKQQKCKDIGINNIYFQSFNNQLRKLSPEDFIKKVILEKFNVDTLVVGFNYSFGYKGEGDVEKLKDLGKKYNFEVQVIEPLIINGFRVSSTLIRDLIREGKVNKVKDYLGHNYIIHGKVSEGKHLGNRFGVPTANLKIDENIILPKSGVYYTKMTIDGQKYDGLTNLGFNPTFPDHPYAIETYVYDFEGDLYGKEVDLEFIEFVRGEKKFKSLEDLFNRIKSDIKFVDEKYRK